MDSVSEAESTRFKTVRAQRYCKMISIRSFDLPYSASSDSTHFHTLLFMLAKVVILNRSYQNGISARVQGSESCRDKKLKPRGISSRG